MLYAIDCIEYIVYTCTYIKYTAGTGCGGRSNRTVGRIVASIYLIAAELRVLRTIVIILAIDDGVDYRDITLRIVVPRAASGVWLIYRHITSGSKTERVRT
jgi:hypothetical protein